MAEEIPGMEKPAKQKTPGANPAAGKPAPNKSVSAKGAPVGGNISELADELNNTSTRLKILEERYDNLRRKIQVVEQNMLTEDKKIITELKTTNQEAMDVRRDMEDLKEKMRLVIKEVKLSAKNEDVAELKKYIEIWEPLNFVTKSELKKLLETEIRELIRDEISNLKQE